MQLFTIRDRLFIKKKKVGGNKWTTLYMYIFIYPKSSKENDLFLIGQKCQKLVFFG